MTFFHNLNKKLDGIAAKPEAAQLNERDMSRAAKGYEKYGKEGMQALAKAGREGKSLDPVRNKYDKYDNEKVDENLLGQLRDRGNIATGQKQQDRKNFDTNTGAALKANSTISGIRAKMQNKVQEGPIDAIKSVGKKVASGINKLVGHGSDADMIRDLQKRMGMPQTGEKPTEPKEGNEFSGNRDAAIKAGDNEFSVDGKTYPVKESDLGHNVVRYYEKTQDVKKLSNWLEKNAGLPRNSPLYFDDVDLVYGNKTIVPGALVDPTLTFNDLLTAVVQASKQGMAEENGAPMTAKQKSFAALAEPRDKITFADKIAGAKKEVDEMLGDVAAEAMRNALGNKKIVADEGWDEMTADVKRRAGQAKVGDVTRGAKHDIKHTATGRIVTRRTDDQGMSVGSETDAEGNTPEKRGRGRPKGAPKGPERTTANAYKHKGERKVKEGEVSTGNLQKMHQLVTGLKSYIQDEDGQAALKELTALIKHYANQDNKQELDEKATSKKQQKFMGMVHAAQKGEKPASKEVGKVAKSMGKKDAEDFASTKHKGLPEKKKSETKESESADSDSDSKEDSPKKSKSKFKFGGSVYETLDAQLETLITEGMSVTVNMSQGDEHGEDRKNITVNADGEDADRLAELLKMAGISQQSSGCSSCGSSPCGCDMIDENNPNWPSDTETSDNAMQYSGGLNGPKSTGQATTPVLASQLRRQVSMEQSAKVEQNLLNLYRTFGK
jgi:hypothetical protein